MRSRVGLHTQFEFAYNAKRKSYFRIRMHINVAFSFHQSSSCTHTLSHTHTQRTQCVKIEHNNSNKTRTGHIYTCERTQMSTKMTLCAAPNKKPMNCRRHHHRHRSLCHDRGAKHIKIIYSKAYCTS